MRDGGGVSFRATQDSFRRRVVLKSSSLAGFLAFGSSQDPRPSHPSGQWPGFWPMGTPLADYSGGTAADFHGLSYYFAVANTAGTHLKATAVWNVTFTKRDCQAPHKRKAVGLEVVLSGRCPAVRPVWIRPSSGTHPTRRSACPLSPAYNVSLRYKALFPSMHPAIG